MEAEQPGGPNLIAKGKEEAQNKELRRARTTAIVFGVIASLSLICLVYAFVQQGIAKENARVANELQIKLDNCEQEAAKQMKLAEAAAEEAKRQHKLLEEALKKIPKK